MHPLSQSLGKSAVTCGEPRLSIPSFSRIRPVSALVVPRPAPASSSGRPCDSRPRAPSKQRPTCHRVAGSALRSPSPFEEACATSVRGRPWCWKCSVAAAIVNILVYNNRCLAGDEQNIGILLARLTSHGHQCLRPRDARAKRTHLRATGWLVGCEVGVCCATPFGRWCPPLRRLASGSELAQLE